MTTGRGFEELHLFPHRPVDLALAVGLFQRLALVVQLFAAAEAELHLGQAAGVEIDLERDEGQAFFVGLVGEFSRSSRRMSSLRGRLGTWFQSVACGYSAMSAPTSQTSPSFTRA